MPGDHLPSDPSVDYIEGWIAATRHVELALDWVGLGGASGSVVLDALNRGRHQLESGRKPPQEDRVLSSPEAVDLAFEFVKMAGGGIIGTYAFNAVDNSRVAGWVKRRKKRERPTAMQTMATARALINQAWPEELPGSQDPHRESYGQNQYEVVLRHLDREYIVRGSYEPDAPPEVERRQYDEPDNLFRTSA